MANRFVPVGQLGDEAAAGSGRSAGRLCIFRNIDGDRRADDQAGVSWTDFLCTETGWTQRQNFFKMYKFRSMYADAEERKKN